ncbi:MAG: extracellular catalytic domain type 1 short-chain-length polyhydroxyalkanoate depolymerase [Isosphaeraceae bacterium]
MQNQASPEAVPPEMRELDALRKNWYKGRHAASNREYWVYIPASYQAGTAVPLIMVLHGCGQPHWSHPWAISYDTHMNQLAEEHQFLVVYPHMYAPPWDENPISCWNFFLPWNWHRVGGEPANESASLAGIVEDMLKNTSRWTIDRQRIYVAGISSGGGATANLGATYPDVFAAIAVHSGGEYGYLPQLLGEPAAPGPDALAPAPAALEPLSEEELLSGELKLRHGLLPKGPEPEEQGKKAFQAMGQYARVMPTIVFHGTDDHISDPENGDQVTQQWITTNNLASGGDFTATFEHPITTEHPAGPHGERPYTVDTWQDIHGRDVVTYYRVAEMRHAWSGGTPGSIFTDHLAPDASTIIYEFFMAHPKPEPAGERGPLAAAPQVTLAELDQRLARIEALLTAATTSSPQQAAGTPDPESGNE